MTFKQLNYTFSIKIRDYKLLPNFIKINVILNDFPTLIFLDNDVIKYHIVGTTNAKKLKEIIKNLHFD